MFGAIRAETGTSDNTRKFTGKEFDADSNLYYYAARYYDPYIGRFTQRDPIGDGVNWYAYTYNNPLKFVDPTGELATITYFGGSGSDPSFSLFWDPDIEHFAFNDGSGVTWFSPEKLTSLLLDFTPIIGDAKGFVEGIIGKELLTGEPLSPVDRFLGLVLLSEVRGVKKGAKLAGDALNAALDLAGTVKVRKTRGNQKGVKITRPDGTIIDITPERVKEWEPEPRNPKEGGTKRKKFDNPQPGSKGYKRDPTQAELDLLDKL